MSAMPARKARVPRSRERTGWHSTKVVSAAKEGSRVALPPEVGRPFEVFVNGVPQQQGRDFDLDGNTLVFRRSLAKEGRLGFFRWLSLLLDVHVPRGRDRIRGHPFPHARVAGVRARGDGTHDVALGQDPDDPAEVAHDDRAHASLDHLRGDLAERVLGRDREHALRHDFPQRRHAASITGYARASSASIPSSSSGIGADRCMTSSTRTTPATHTPTESHMTAPRPSVKPWRIAWTMWSCCVWPNFFRA